jgi:uncharacterized protein
MTDRTVRGSLVRNLVVPQERGLTLTVRRGQLLSVIAAAGPQTCDFNAFVLPDYRERFSAGRTRHFAGINPGIGDSLWSNPPHDRELFTIVDDTVGENDLLYPRCSRLIYDLAGLPDHRSCQDNIAEAIEPYGLTADDVHDTFNIFMNTRVDEAGRLHIDKPTTRAGDHVDILCHIDCLVCLSACPDGDKHDRENLPLSVELYDAA